MLRLGLLGLLLLVGCKASRDCEAYAQKFTDTIEPAPERVASILEVSRRSCESGRVPDKEIACVARAEDANDIRRCQGLAPLSEAPAPAPEAAPPPPPAPTGTTKVSLAGTKKGTFLLVPSEMTTEQAEWYAKLEKGVAACETATVHPPRTHDVVVFFTQGFPTVDVAGFPVELGQCLSLAFNVRQPASVPMGSMMFPIAMGQ